jgi:hypothetical protein
MLCLGLLGSVVNVFTSVNVCTCAVPHLLSPWAPRSTARCGATPLRPPRISKILQDNPRRHSEGAGCSRADAACGVLHAQSATVSIRYTVDDVGRLGILLAGNLLAANRRVYSINKMKSRVYDRLKVRYVTRVYR